LWVGGINFEVYFGRHGLLIALQLLRVHADIKRWCFVTDLLSAAVMAIYSGLAKPF
jgi:hypothetical protein